MDIEPLDAELWFSALNQLDQRRKLENGSGLERQLRLAYLLQQLAPRPLRERTRPTCDERAYEALLESGAYESASRALVGPPFLYTIRILAEHAVEAAVRMPGDGAAILVCAAEPASALLGAWLGCLQGLRCGALMPRNEPEGPEVLKVSAGTRPLN